MRGKKIPVGKSRFICCRAKAESAEVKRRMYAKCNRNSTLPTCFEAHSTDMGEIKVNNNAADAIPEVDLVCGEAKPDFLLKWSAEDMPDTIVKKRGSLCSWKMKTSKRRG